MPSSCLVDGIATINCIGPLLQIIITWLFYLGIGAAFVFIIYAGYRFITSGGDAKQVETARKILTYTIIGLAIILSAFFIINIIAGFTGVSCIKVFGFSNCGASATDTGGGSALKDHCTVGTCMSKLICNSANDLKAGSGTCAISNSEMCCQDITPPTDNCPVTGSWCVDQSACNAAHNLEYAGSGSCVNPDYVCCEQVNLDCPSTTYPNGFCSYAECQYGEYGENFNGFINCPGVPYCCKPAPTVTPTPAPKPACPTATGWGCVQSLTACTAGVGGRGYTTQYSCSGTEVCCCDPYATTCP